MTTPPPAELLARLKPSSDALLLRLRPLVTDELLNDIAAADYGSDFYEHFRALKPLRDELAFPNELEWHPHEVLALIRWSEPENPNWKPGREGLDGHVMRAFCCACLLRAGDNDGGENQTIAQLIGSAFTLGDEFARDALSLLAWRLGAGRDLYDDGPFFGFGALLLAARLGFEEDVLLALARWVDEELARQKTAGADRALGPWLLGTTFHNLRHERWLELARAELGRARPDAPRAEETLRAALARLDAPWEDLAGLDEALLGRSVRSGSVRLWPAQDAVEVLRVLSGRIVQVKAVGVHAARDGEWMETERVKLDQKQFNQELVASAGSSVRAPYKAACERAAALIRERARPELRFRIEIG